MYIGDSYILKINGKIGDGNWESSNPSVASVTGKGRIRAKSNGRTTITAQIGKKTYHCAITVRIPVQAIIPNEGWVDLDGPKKKFKLKATLYPQNAYNKKLTFKSTDESIAIVSKNRTITALSNGTCKIKITAADRNKLSRYIFAAKNPDACIGDESRINKVKSIFFFTAPKKEGFFFV